jgi:hypothetical protein
MTWKEILPINRLELWIIRLAMTVALIGFGFGLGLFYTQSRWQQGADWMYQKVYADGEKRVVR